MKLITHPSSNLDSSLKELESRTLTKDYSDDKDLELIQRMTDFDGNHLSDPPGGPYRYAIRMWNTQLCCSMNPIFKNIFRCDLHKS